MKHVIVEGWRGINHSLAMVNQFQLIELLNMVGVKIYHRDLPNLNPSWNETDNDSGLPSDIKERIKAIPSPEWGWYDSVYCMQSREGKPRPLADKVITYLITEFGLKVDTDKNAYIESLCHGDNLVVNSSNWVIHKLVEFGFPPEKIVSVPHGVNPGIYFPPTLEEQSMFRPQFNATAIISSF